MKKLLAICLSLASMTALAQTATIVQTEDRQIQTKRGNYNVGPRVATEAACVEEIRKDTIARRASAMYTCNDVTVFRSTFSAAPAPVPCPSQPAATTATMACPSGTVGSWTQTTPYVSAPAPTCWVAGTPTPAAAPSGSCVTLPAQPAASQTVACPSGTTGSWTQTRTVARIDVAPYWQTGEWTPTTAPSGSCVPVVTNPPPTATGPTYYFSDCQAGAAANCVPGSNANAGTSEAAPKQNLAGFNVNSVPAGTRLLFKRGGAWINFRQVVENMNASAANPLVFDAYGTGPAPLLKTASENMFILGGNWANTSNDGGYVIRNLKLDGQGTATWGIWFLNTVRNVIVENTEITGFGIGINSNDSDSHGVTDIILRNNVITRNRAMGMLGHYNNILIEGNTFSFNATGSTFDHGSYIGGGNNITLRNNYYNRNSVVNGVCSGGNMTFHGQIDGLLVEGNTIEQDSATPGCWLMSVTRGYTSAEWFRNAVIRNNKLINGGNTMMAVQSAPNVLVEGNVAINTNPTFSTAFGIGVGSAVPTGGDAGDSPDTGAVVRNNVYCRAHASATGGVASVNSPGGEVTNNTVLTGAAATTGVCAR